jgi:hypothetical protein
VWSLSLSHAVQHFRGVVTGERKEKWRQGWASLTLSQEKCLPYPHPSKAKQARPWWWWWSSTPPGKNKKPKKKKTTRQTFGLPPVLKENRTEKEKSVEKYFFDWTNS